MKKIFSLLSMAGLLFVFIAAMDANNATKNTLEGVWELEHQYIWENNEIIDTLYNFDGYRQVKMYSQGKVMWTRYNPADSNEWFGYGTYDVKGDILEEQLEYASDAMMKIVDTVQVFRFQLEFLSDGYRQTSLDDEGNRYTSETYKRVE